MASRISVFVDIVGDKANSTLKSISTSFKDADGAAGKFKAGVGAAFTSLQQNAGSLAVAGGAALVTFGVKAVGAFQETALAAGEMRDALGLTSEEASQYIELADDLGIGPEKFEASVKKMLVTAEKTPAALDAIGASLVKNADGTTNTSKSFQEIVDKINAIPDASQRAKAASDIFGRGWTDMAELIAMGGKGIQEALDAVEGGKVIDDAEVEKARKFRDTLDELKGVGEQAAIVLGGEVVDSILEIKEVVDDAERVFGPLIDAAKELAEQTGGTGSDSLFGAAMRAINPMENLKQSIGDVRDIVDEATGSTEEASEAVVDYTESSIAQTSAAVDAALAQQDLADETAASEAATDAHARAIQEHNEGLQEAYDKLHNVTDAFADLRGELSEREGFLGFQNSLDELKAKSEEAWYAAATGADNAEQAVRDAELAQIDLKNQVIDYAEKVGTIPPEAVSNVIALIDEGKLFEAEQALANLMRDRTATGILKIKTDGRGGSGVDAKDGPGRASGGDVWPGTRFPVGEGGEPEIFEQNGKQYLIPGDRGRVTPFKGTTAAGGVSSSQPPTVINNYTTIYTTDPTQARREQEWLDRKRGMTR